MNHGLSNRLYSALLLAILAIAGAVALSAPWLAPGITARYSPFYSQVFDAYLTGYTSSSALARLVVESSDNDKYVIRMLESPTLERRRLAAVILGVSDYYLGDSVESMIRALGDVDAKVRIQVAAGLALRHVKIAEPAMKRAISKASTEEERAQLESCLDEL